MGGDEGKSLLLFFENCSGEGEDGVAALGNLKS